ncbi:hypothetical protein ACLMJK_008563 [Lecanora helva]
MTSINDRPGPGGFLQPILPSPPPSSADGASIAPTVLPASRSTPLKKGATKESSFIDHVDRKLLGISRRYEKRHNTESEDDPSTDLEGKGYATFGELANDLEGLIDVIWVSGTPSLQTPYLLTIALTTCSYLPSFSFSPRATFRLLHKLDLAFCSLLQGINVETNEQLPGFEGGRGKVSTTEKVRMRSLVERTRIAVVDAADKDGSTIDGQSAAQSEDDFVADTDDDEDDEMEGSRLDGNHGRWEMEIARTYERTIMELGMALSTS